MTKEKKKEDKQIVVGLRDDGSLYFDLSPGIHPHEAIGMARWLAIAIETNVERQHMIGAGGTLEAIRGVLAEVRSFEESVRSSQTNLMNSFKRSAEATKEVVSFVLGGLKDGSNE